MPMPQGAPFSPELSWMETLRPSEKVTTPVVQTLVVVDWLPLLGPPGTAARASAMVVRAMLS